MISFIGIVIILIGVFSLIKFNPPLVSGTVASSYDYNTVMVEVGNKGFGNVKIKEVLVNDNETPLKFKIQVSNPFKGFIVTDTFDKETKGYEMIEIKDVAILPDTSPLTQLEKVNNGTATENDKSYGLSVVHNNVIEVVIITYSYLGFSFENTVQIKM